MWCVNIKLGGGGVMWCVNISVGGDRWWGVSTLNL